MIDVASFAGSVGYATILASYASEMGSHSVSTDWKYAHAVGVAGYAAMLTYVLLHMAAPKSTKAAKVVKTAGIVLLLTFMLLQSMGFALHEIQLHDLFGVAGLALMLVPDYKRLAAAFMTTYYALSAFEHCVVADGEEPGQCLGRAALVGYYLDIAMTPASH